MSGLAGLMVLLLVALLLAVGVLSAIVCRDILRPPRRTAGYAAAHGLAIDPAEAGWSCESWSVERPGGAIPVWEIDARKRGHKLASATAVFVHDWGESRIDVLARIEPWARRCARLILYDRPGHGEAGRGALRRGEHADLLALLEQSGAGPYLIVARGTGAAVAIAAAARSTQARIAGIVAEHPVLRLRAWLRRRLRSAGAALWPLADLAQVWLAACGAGLGNVMRDAARLRCPLLIVDGPDAHELAATAARSQVLPELAPEALKEFMKTCLGPGAEEAAEAVPVAPVSTVTFAEELVYLAYAAYRQARRVVVLVVGVSVVLVGVCMIVLPGPAFIVIPLGLGILGLEFAWARAWLKKLKRTVLAARDRMGALVSGDRGADRGGDRGGDAAA